MQFTPVTSAASLREGHYIRFVHEGTTHIGRLVNRMMSLRAEVKGHPGWTPAIVERRADVYENLDRRFAADVTNVERITFEPGDEVKFTYRHRDTTYEGRLYKDHDSSVFLRADVPVNQTGYRPNIINPNTNEIAGAVSGLWPIVEESRPAESEEALDATETDIEELQKKIRSLEWSVRTLENANRVETARWREAETRLDTLRSEVGEKAMELAREHGWCSVVDDALRELGIEPPQTETRMSVTVEFDIVATSTDQRRDITTEWVTNSLIFGDGEEGTVGLDTDWEDVVVDGGRVVSVDITEG